MQRVVLWCAALAIGALLVASCGDEFVTATPPGSGGTAATTTSVSGGAGGSTTTTTSSQGGTSTTPTTTAGGAGGTTSGCTVGGDACSQCRYTKCPTQYCDCQANDQCPLLLSCLESCGNGDCHQTCKTNHAGGIAVAMLLLECSSDQCTSSCPASSMYTFSPCVLCACDLCPDEINACLGDETCANLLHCMQDCAGNPTCHDACTGSYGNAQPIYEPLQVCMAANCNNCG